MASKKLSVRVRMYRQGLGDCFLLTFRRGTKDVFNMMVDCGIFLGTKNSKEIMTKVAEDVKNTTGGRLNAVVLTHEHWDHIAGFSLAKEIFDQQDFVFDEVWTSWTENEDDPKFTKVRERFKKKKQGLRAALNEMTSKKAQGLKETVNALVNEFFGEDPQHLELVGMSGADTWKYVLQKSVAQPPKYCSPGEVHTFKELEGVRFYVLGPPENYELLDDEESPADETYRQHLRMALTESFLAAATGADNSLFDADAALPFDDKYKIAADRVEHHPKLAEFFRTNYGFDEEGENAWRQIEEDWLEMAGDLALNIDGITNNTCLALAIELVESGKVLIFPGDAQFGNWISWQGIKKWEAVDKNGNKKESDVKVDVNDLLKRTVFYKVGHHGSHNATLKKSGLERMESAELVAMIPTNKKFAENQKTKKTPDGWKMPEQELLDRLEEKSKGRVILADEYGGAADDKKPFRERCGKYNLPAAESKKFLNSVNFGGGTFLRLPDDANEEPLYVEYIVKE